VSLNIKDPEVHAMARQVAATHGISMTGAVREALKNVPRSWEINDLLYDEHGAPK
jgi:hypothetical protein